jgi:hypothetical protein
MREDRLPAHRRATADARVRARQELRRVEDEAARVWRRFARVAAAHFRGRVTDADLEDAEREYEDALRARTRLLAAVQGLSGDDLLRSTERLYSPGGRR